MLSKMTSQVASMQQQQIAKQYHMISEDPEYKNFAGEARRSPKESA